MYTWRSLSPLLVALGVACAAPADRSADSSGTALRDTPAEVARPVSDSGVLQEGDETIRWRSTEQAGVIVSISEQVTFGTDGRLERTLTYDSTGVLQQVRESRTQTVQHSDRSPSIMMVTIELSLAADSVTRASKQVDGAMGTVEPYEVDRIRRHAVAMLQLARRSVR